MKNRTTIILIGTVFIVLAVDLYISLSKRAELLPVREESNFHTTNSIDHVLVSNFKNATYVVDGRQSTLVNGVEEVPTAPGSSEKIRTRYFGNEATGDLNGDTVPDTVFLITQETGGTGVFYYAVAALKEVRGYKMTNAFFIGDRIAPQSTEIHSGEIYINYAERKDGEPMTAQPSVGVTKLLKVTQDGILNGLMQ